MLSGEIEEGEVVLDYMNGADLREMRRMRRENWRWFLNEMPIRGDIDKQWEWYEEMCEDDTRQMFGIYLGGMDGMPETRIFCGCVGYKDLDRRSQKAEFGNLVVDENLRGKGIARIGCSLLMQFMFDQMNMNRLYLEVLSDNEAAIKLYEGLGFVREGEKREDVFSFGGFRNTVMMAIIREDWGME
jgi:RimJ/RimL family protein N-acetyltransferase